MMEKVEELIMDTYEENILFEDENYIIVEAKHLKSKGILEIQIINNSGEVVDSIFNTHDIDMYNAIRYVAKKAGE